MKRQQGSGFRIQESIQGSGFRVQELEAGETHLEVRRSKPDNDVVLSTEYSVPSTSEPNQQTKVQIPRTNPPQPRTLNPERSEPERYELREPPRYHFDLDRRDVLKALGGGLVVCLVAGSARAQQRGRGGRGGGGNRPTQIGGYLHIAENGQITLYCGKTEVGQNVRTSVAQAAAEELRVAPTAIHVILADTDLVPDDGGTSGSRSTPSTIPQIRRVGAAARDLLLDLAARQMVVDRAALVLDGHKVTHAATGRTLTFGDLTRGQKLTIDVSATATPTPTSEWKVLGTSTPKLNAYEIVTGAHQFASDVRLPGMLLGKVLRAPAIDARLQSVDLAGAKALPNVVAVHDGDFVGVAAPTAFEAERALARIRATWSPTAMQSSSGSIYDDLRASGGGNPPADPALEAAFEAAAHTLEATYPIAYIAHAPLEPRTAVAQWHEGKLTVWTGTQQPFGVRGNLAAAFNLPAERVRVIVPDTGAGYGGKHTVDTTIEAARLAKAAGKPVKITWTRAEEFTWAYFRPAGVIRVRAGISADGLLTAWDFHNYNSGQSGVRSPYECGRQRAEFHQARSPLKQGSYRALAATANHFARESHINELAEFAELDPLQFRLKNLKDDRLRAVLLAAAEKFGWGQRQWRPGRGFGLAGGTEKGSYVATCAEVAADSVTGKIRVVRAVTAFECGKVLNPDHLKNQIEGAVVQGLGGALFEAIEFAGGRIQNASFAAYRVPRFADTPELETVLVDRPDLAPLGAGETPIVCIAPALSAAIAQAAGVRPRSLPMSASFLSF